VLLIVHDTGAQTSASEGQLKSSTSDSLFQNVTIDCLDVKFKLTKIHEDDGLKRVNTGQLYEAVSTKLMARLGSRIVQNRLDGAELIKKASEYETALNNFRADYQVYEVAMNSLIKSDCSTQPMIFYNSLQNVRDLRSKVNTDTKQLTRVTKEYYETFLNFSERVKEERDKK
jgi:hypothetical protein